MYVSVYAALSQKDNSHADGNYLGNFPFHYIENIRMNFLVTPSTSRILTN